HLSLSPFPTRRSSDLVERAQLLKSLGHVHRVVERRNTIPVLSNVLMKADGASLRLKATDLDIEVVETLPAEVATAGGTTVHQHRSEEHTSELQSRENR